MNNHFDRADVPTCACCGDTENTPFNPMITLAGTNEDDAVVHRACAQHDSQFGFCRYCGTSVAYPAELINGAGECPEHYGESVPDYPVEDLESYIENVQNQ